MTATATPALVCPPWCTTTADEHARDLAIPYNDCTFHRSAVVDAWQTPHQYADQVVDIEVRTRTWEDVSTGRKETCVDIDGDLSRGSEDFSELAPDDARRLAIAMLAAAEIADRSPDELRAPDQSDVDTLRDLLDLLESAPTNDQRARYLLSSNWMRDRGAIAGARLLALLSDPKHTL